MVRLNRIYTRTGDAGSAGLVDGSRVSKSSARIQAIGDVDEANAAVGLALSPLGEEGAYAGMLLLAMFAFGALVWAVYLLGTQCFGWAAGALAAFVVATREPFLSQGMRAYVDVPFLALVMTAAVLEARRERRGTPVLVLRFEGHTAQALERIEADFMAALRRVKPDARIEAAAH